MRKKPCLTWKRSSAKCSRYHLEKTSAAGAAMMDLKLCWDRTCGTVMLRRCAVATSRHCDLFRGALAEDSAGVGGGRVRTHSGKFLSLGHPTLGGVNGIVCGDMLLAFLKLLGESLRQWHFPNPSVFFEKLLFFVGATFRNYLFWPGIVASDPPPRHVSFFLLFSVFGRGQILAK